ncbi:acyl-coA-binding protein, ACBP [Deinococcus geothermalis DSM 11300]|uniref:Acyl-coA-binding protein, ACBP n=1 Tax=Deinococcus geothermalis (strain DSM 11300 / CIP 105573 / AG-3a) TaxID=319795 RepID=Q1J1D7_DEIGD|nr:MULTISPECIES: acyl-CoA-binding protein [Deinococcus]ABF44697.1 acyl-coA-binding protein, ACBP [Deinococcus geothermalis DSM 11300]MBI0445843.1 acyl-CoA-binding protein [Deinococcus sp. DB0503]
MSFELQNAFEQAQQEVQGLSEKPRNDVLLKLYALYKQGTVGDVTGERPGGFDFVGSAKYDAWAKLRGLSREEAQREYVNLVETLKARR